MKILEIEAVLARIRGCTFAGIDTMTYPRKGLRKCTTGESVILFTNKHSSGYENMVRRKLKKAGKNPDDFTLSDLPWGERVPDTPLITNKGEYYLQTILLTPGKSEYFIGDLPIQEEYLDLRKRTNAVLVNTYKLESILRIAILGKELRSVPS